MTHGHGLWFWLSWACVIWYSTITVYVAVRGFADIKTMLRNLKDGQKEESAEKKIEP